jgi:thioredoxin-related protein
MSKKLHRKIELMTNISIILVAVLLGYFLVQKLFFTNQTQPVPAKEIAKGTKLSVPDIDWQGNQKTVLLALQKGCKFCTESMPFYKTLIEKSKQKGVRLVAVLPNSNEEGVQYLKENGVEIQEVKQAKLDSIDVRGTPTLILVNDKGEVQNSWIGKLSAQKEQEVQDSL